MDDPAHATLDPETIELLIRLEGTSQPGILVRLAQAFDTTGSELVLRMRASIETPSPAAFARDAHSLKGAAGAIGALRLKRACAEAEKLDATSAPGAVLTVLDRVSREFELARSALASLPERERRRTAGIA